MRNFNCIPAVILLVITVSAGAQNRLEPFIPFKTDMPPVIDGILDDSVWQKAPSETGFKTWYPDFGIDMKENTIVYYAYDRENLYFAYRCFDSQPGRIKAAVTSRDNIRSDDWICLNLDTFNDQQSLYAFYVNPIGIQMDSRAVGETEDLSVDAVWYSDGRIDDKGYTIEIMIPFKSIRYANRERVEMGIIFERKISRLSEMGTYPPLDPKYGPNFIIQTRPLIFEGIKKSLLFESLPAVTYRKNSTLDNGKLISGGGKADFSYTAKYGITSHLILGGTYNPDFSQVEADVGQVDFNRRYALFYPEKRSFFLEGRENFNFGGSAVGDPLKAVVHTRTIADPVLGIKLTGKIGEKNTIASIFAEDEPPEYLQEGGYVHVAILRYKRALSQDSYIGGFYTGREYENGANRVIGADGQIRVSRPSRIGFYAFMSQSKNGGQSTNDTGHAAGMNYYYNSRDMLLNMRFYDLSEDFYTETGYVARTGITGIRAGVQRMLYPDSKIVRRIEPLINSQNIRDKFSRQWENEHYFGMTLVLPRTSYLQMGYAFASEIFLSEKFDTGGFSILGSSQYTKQFHFSLSYSYGKKIRYSADPYQGKGSGASGSVTCQPSDKFSSSLRLTYTDFYRNADSRKEYDYTILRSRNTYQINKYLFFRGIIEHNSFRKTLLTDFLASFTYIPGTVIHCGYGSLYEKVRWIDGEYRESAAFLETKRGLFFKASYLWRL